MTTAIINLDLINEITHKNGKIAGYADRIESEKIIGNINKINQWAREQKYLVIHVKVGFNHHYLDSSHISPIFSKAQQNNILCLTEWGCQYHSELVVKPTDIEVIKHRISAFYGTDLDLICRSNQINHVILTGVSTSMAVELTAREAHDRDYKVTIVTDATTCASDTEKNSSLSILSRIAALSSTQELLTLN